MSRPLRIEYPGAWYHVMNRGRRSEAVFTDRNDYRLFLDLLEEASELWNIKISAFCLMPNHYHLLVHTPEGNLSRCMRHINGVYTQRFNRIHQCDGQLFRGRFKSILVEGDSYLLQLVRYIHRNPIRDGLVDKLDKYPWSSHKGYMTESKKWNWLYKDFILAMVSSEKNDPRAAYMRFIARKDNEKTLKVFNSRKLPSYLGGKKFTEWVKETFFARKEHIEIPESTSLAPDIQKIRDIVCTFYGVSDEHLNTSKRGVFNESRHAAIYLTRVLRNEGLETIRREFSTNRYSSASSAIERIKKRIAKDRTLRKRMDSIRIQLTKGQTKT